MLLKKLLACVLFWFASIDLIADTLRIAGSSEGLKLENKLAIELIKRGGEHDYVYPFAGAGDVVPFSAVLKSARDGDIDLFWTMTNPELEKDFIPIRIPIYRGMLGMRVALVKAENKKLFENVKSLNDLKAFTAGQGRLWTDTKILESNGLTVVKELKYTNMFRMLEADRFDYFPRGINEISAEVEREAKLNLAAEESLLIWYKVPFYFFVNPAKPEVAKHLTEAFEGLVADGTFMKLFYQDEMTRSGIANAGFENRTIIKLDNPFLTPETPLDRNDLWFDPLEIPPAH